VYVFGYHTATVQELVTLIYNHDRRLRLENILYLGRSGRSSGYFNANVRNRPFSDGKRFKSIAYSVYVTAILRRKTFRSGAAVMPLPLRSGRTAHFSSTPLPRARAKICGDHTHPYKLPMFCINFPRRVEPEPAFLKRF
jgi:hypothetical protein